MPTTIWSTFQSRHHHTPPKTYIFSLGADPPEFLKKSAVKNHYENL